MIADVVGRNIRAFEAVAEHVPTEAVDLELVGRHVRVRVAGTDLADALLAALRHRARPALGGARPDLEIVSWNFDASGVAADVAGVPPAPEQDAARTALLGADGFVQVQGTPPFAVQAHDRPSGRAFAWFRGVEDLLAWGERTKPLLELFHSWLRDSPWQPVHAAAVAPGGAGVLLAGPSGSGKSTTALACLDAGWCYAGDDFVAVSTAPTIAANLYSSARLKPDMARLLPFSGAEVGVVHLNGVEKRDLLLDGHVTDDRIRDVDIAAIVLPRVTGAARSSMRPATAAAALIGVSSVTMHLLRFGGAEAFAKLSALVDQVPAFHLDLGPDLDALPDLLATAAGGGA